MNRTCLKRMDSVLWIGGPQKVKRHFTDTTPANNMQESPRNIFTYRRDVRVTVAVIVDFSNNMNMTGFYTGEGWILRYTLIHKCLTYFHQKRSLGNFQLEVGSFFSENAQVRKTEISIRYCCTVGNWWMDLLLIYHEGHSCWLVEVSSVIEFGGLGG